MKINLNSINKENFTIHEHIVNDEKMYLVQPMHIGCKWDKDNLIFRSSLWSENGELASAGFPKFFNWGEQSELSPIPTSLKDTQLIEKMDGSLLIVSKYKGNFIHRTRGTSDAFKLENGYEVSILKEKYPMIYEYEKEKDTWEFSLLFEWVSNINQIIIRYDNCPNFYLVGLINHVDYSLMQQKYLDVFAERLNCIRPIKYEFNSIVDMVTSVKNFKDKEGLVVYSNKGQTLHKVKGEQYLKLHRMKSELSSQDKIIDVWLSLDMPDYHKFYIEILERFDYELAEFCKNNIEKICKAKIKVDNIIEDMLLFVKELKLLSSRKEQAQKVLQFKKEYSAFIFKLLDGKELNKDCYKKLIANNIL